MRNRLGEDGRSGEGFLESLEGGVGLGGPGEPNPGSGLGMQQGGNGTIVTNDLRAFLSEVVGHWATALTFSGPMSILPGDMMNSRKETVES